jgi:3-oxoacyl-[acyl-carrier protein] reductase
MDLGLATHAALITGGSRGIGRATAFALAREGARICLAARGAEDLSRTAAELQAAGAQVATAAVDLSTQEGCEKAVQACVRAFGGIHLLVNNAGGSLGSGPFDTATAAQWKQVLDLNLWATVWCSQYAVEWMKANGGGSIVHVSSVCGREYCTSAPYTASKAAVVGLGKEMAVDLAKHRIRVNVVAPGSIMFPGGSWDRRQQKQPELIEKMKQEQLPWGRFGTPEEVAEVVAFIGSPKAAWVTGSCVVVDGAQGRAY